MVAKNMICAYSGLPSLSWYLEQQVKPIKKLSFDEYDKDRIIQMAWEDRTPFEAIRTQFGLEPGQVIKLMRKRLKPSSFRLWRKRTTGRNTKHLSKRSFDFGRFRSKSQRG